MWSRQPERRSGYHYPAERAWREKLPERSLDWVIGIGVGIALGIAVIVAFLYFGSEGTIDAPRISGVDSGKPARQARPQAPSPGEFSSPEGK